MQNNSQNFSFQDMMRIAQSPTGKQLLGLLAQENPEEVKKIAQLASAGNISQAKDVLQQMLNTEEKKSLLQQLGATNG